MNDPRDPQTEAQIRRALSARAQEVRVTPDALPSIRGRRPNPWSRPLAYAGAAAVIVLVLVGVGVLTGGDDDPIDSVDTPDYPRPTTSPPDTTSPPSTAPPVDDPPQGEEPLPSFYGPVSFIDRTGDAWTAEPLASSWRLVNEVAPYWPAEDRSFAGSDDVSLAYLEEVHGITDPGQIASVGYNVPDAELGYPNVGSAPTGFRRTSEGGEALGMGMIIGAAADDTGRWYIGQVATDRLWIDTVESSAEQPGLLRITGGGEAFEGTALLTIGDGEPTIIGVGAFGPDTFTTVVPWDGHTPVRVTLSATDPIDGALPHVVGAMAEPVVFDGPLDPSIIDEPTAQDGPTWSVFGVAADDVLNVRSGPGVENPIVGTLAPDAVGVDVDGEAERVGSQTWVPVNADGLRGWVNRRFLVVGADTALTPLMEDRLHDEFLVILSNLDPMWFRGTVEIGGIGVYADFPTPWTSIGVDELGAVHNFSPEGTEDRRDPDVTDTTVRTFLGFETAPWELIETNIGPDVDREAPNLFWAVGQPPEFFDRYTTGTVYIPEPNPDVSLDWRRYTVVFDLDTGEPFIRGIWRWGWTP
ncbi:MAG: SH3 domain-containing protein [Actinomycetota bacterium]